MDRPRDARVRYGLADAEVINSEPERKSMKRPRVMFVNGYRPALRYRFLSRCRNGVTAWLSIFGASFAVHLWIA